LNGHAQPSVARSSGASLKADPPRPHDPPSLTPSSERGSALVIALLIMVIMTLLGLAFVLAGQTESKIAVNQRNGQQALHLAESGVRIVKKWFDAPTGTSAYLVPTTSQVDRTQRWVDDNNDGTYSAYSSATAPYNVVYRNGTDDPFEKPYRGSPSLAFMGTEAHPDRPEGVRNRPAQPRSPARNEPISVATARPNEPICSCVFQPSSGNAQNLAKTAQLLRQVDAASGGKTIRLTTILRFHRFNPAMLLQPGDDLLINRRQPGGLAGRLVFGCCQVRA